MNGLLGVVVSMLYGVLIGNALTTAFFRVPRDIPLNGLLEQGGKKPHCSDCGHALRYWEYFPILSWVSTRWNCNYCGVKTDLAYPVLEIGTMIMALFLYFILGVNDRFILLVLLAATAFLNLMLLLRYRRIFLKSSLIMLACGMVNLLYWMI
jgi:leader peptidase (prepilin peptidase)/N-methyltransferase